MNRVYVEARRVLLDALQALDAHIQALTLIGAQAVYIHTGEIDLAVSPLTGDSDLMVDPSIIGDSPTLDEALGHAGFEQRPNDVGRWHHRDTYARGLSVPVDLLTPDEAAGGNRAALIAPHGRIAVRRATGLVAALSDNDLRDLNALDPTDQRSVRIRVAGPAALLVAKAFKIAEREERRRVDKDALDVYRLLRATSTEDLGGRIARLLDEDRCRNSVVMAMEHLSTLFGTATSPGSTMAGRVIEAGGGSAVETAAGCTALFEDLRAFLATGHA